MSKFYKFIDLIKENEEDLIFTIAEIGAHPYGNFKETFHSLLDYFPNSKIYAFEVNKEECDKLNKICKKGMKFFPYALGEKKERRKFYNTYHPVCSSLYEPNEEFIKLYNKMNVAYLKNVTEVDTISLDDFKKIEQIKSIDFIKIDIQGAELDVFKGASNTLKDVLMIVSEVEFVEHYKNQPLFGNVSEFLNKKNFMFHKFLGLSGRALKPVVLKNDETFPSQHMWSDAMFILNFKNIYNTSDSNLLKMAVLSFLYNSPDLTFFYLKEYDKRRKTFICESYQKIF
tara:strand:+ start:2722 stop:3576 length:855 start_codon:yes stop_codon:yes gene_type:complete